MSLSRDSLAERQLKLIRRTEFRLRQGLQRLQWEEDVLLPEIEALKAGKAVLGLPAGSAFEIVIDAESHAHPDPAQAKPVRRKAGRRAK